ncbi:DUF1559 family PulG-like putative transporter [Limnoglobus roseus]|uniref:DUF1559 domain-containing protein n=1 Tax=Limnoglobus roseus TaxID=2598579 RepID=A0A5C1AL37_9BACT|nr:DUF1559 domain-containing protein [Limnoglobus roseus]QEL19660.1 hypothetical protein PX52LOC_06737 [Limnoglobus roseus]
MSSTLGRTFAAACFAILSLSSATAQQPAGKPTSWTLDEAMQELRYAPDDVYLQYVAAQLARREGKFDQFSGLIGRQARNPNSGRGRSTDLFGTFTGALAVQESLQLDTMLGPPPGAAPPGVDKPSVKVSTLTGPTVQSHPWEKLLGAKKPDVGPFPNCVPPDFYLAEFKSVGKLTEATTVGTVYSGHVFVQMLGQSWSELTMERIKAQLGLLNLPATVIDRFGVEGVAVTGSDLFLSEGSDVTVLVRGPNVVAAADAISKMGSAKLRREDSTHVGIAYSRQWSEDGRVNAFVASPSVDLHVRGNSLPAFRRVLEAIAGKTADGTPAKRLSETAEFRYVRSLMPRGVPEEDGFLYLSDAFIRNTVGPQLKLTERRRMLVYNHLRMIGHACLMFRTEFGRPPTSLQELADKQCAPGVFGQGLLTHPDGGTYSLSPDGTSGVCSRYGSAAALTPCLERLPTEVTAQEAEEYKRFVKEYEQYWRTYFDPIAVRVQVAPEQLRLETLVLPLIDNSIYTEMARALGGKPIAFDTLPTAKSCIGSLFFQLNKDPYLAKLAPAAGPKKPTLEGAMVASNNLKQIGLAMHNYHDATTALPPAAITDAKGKALLSWRVAILPYIEQQPLYQQFKLDEPWDSVHNLKLVEKMPAVYQGLSKALNKQGKTQIKAVTGKDTLFPPGGKGVKFSDVTDGLSNTILAVTAAEAEAVEWTKPDDWAFDAKSPTRGLTQEGRNAVLVLISDGSTRTIPLTTAEKDWVALFTRAGGEVVEADNLPDARPGNFSIFDMPFPDEFLSEIDTANVRRFLADGIGDQVGVHMFDESRLLDFDFAGVLGGSTNNSLGLGGRDRLGIGMLVQFFIRPTAVSIPVKDAKLVDEMLDAMDRWTVEAMGKAEGQSRGFLPITPEFYRVKFPTPHTIRCSTVKFFGFKIRYFWGRIGNGLYVANRPFVLEDIATAHAVAEKAGGAKAADGPKGNAMLRIRPENWNRVLPGYRLGWAENDRAACQANFSLLTSVGRGWNDRGATDEKLLARVAQVYGTRPHCPEGGRYTLTPDGRDCACSVHGSRMNPLQPAEPTSASASGKWMANLSGVIATLTFQDDGLHAVVISGRKKP